MNRRNTKGFTLIELLIVLVIVGLLASLVAPKMFGKVDSSMRKTAETQMKLIEGALDAYRLDMGRYPEALNELMQSTNPRWDGPYLPREVPADPWGNPYIYSVPGEDGAPYKLLSYGRDGRPGGEGDDADIIHK